ncbi:hemicentin-1-like isoform X2 [Lytechinus variegatus]|uniref:hemicentin-1-like isoform X2 n=1 Tax=Lytechinus variegatus TaxID=7654 RepID=UPI001BB2B20B|nr:hemicentin-1-like isoform X2 [Lytechinus variegatus]
MFKLEGFQLIYERMNVKMLVSFLRLILLIHLSSCQEQSLCPYIGQITRSQLPAAEVSHFYDDLHDSSPPSGDDPHFITTETQSEIRAIEGNEVSLHCEIANLGINNKRLWYKYDSGQKHVIAMENNSWGKYYLNMTKTSYSLWFPRVHRSNACRYSCAFKTSEGEEELVFTLDVSYRPEIKDILPNNFPFRHPNHPRKIFVNETENITLYCNSSGSPSPYITWRKDDAPELGICVNKSLQLLDVSPNQSGAYTCTSENSLGDVSETIILIVQYRPRVLAKSTDLRGAKGRYLQLQCSADAIPRARFHWQKDGKMIDYPDSDSYVIISLNPETNYGTYTCVATNFLGSARAHINVTGLPMKPEVVSGINGRMKNVYLLRWRTSKVPQDAITEQLTVDYFLISCMKVVKEKVDGGSPRIRYYPPDSMRHTYYTKKHEEYHSYPLRHLSSNSTYKVTLCPFNQYGKGECTVFNFTTSFEDYVTEPSPTMSKVRRDHDAFATIPTPLGVVRNDAIIPLSPSSVFITIIILLLQCCIQYR